MADEPIKESTPSAPAATPAASPAASAPHPAAAPASQESATAPSAESPAAAASAEQKAEPTVAETPTLLEAIKDKDAKVEAKPEVKAGDKPPAEKPADTKTEQKPGEQKADDKAVEAKAAEPAKPAPVEYKYELPKTVTMDDAQKGEFHAAMDELRGADPSVGAQKLIALYEKSMEQFAQHFAQETRRHQQKTFLDTRKQWATEIMADPILGGSGHQTAAATVARMRDLLVPSELTQKRKFDDGKPRDSAFDEFLRITGAGDHPVFWHILHNAAKWADEPQALDAPNNIKPPKDIGQEPGKRGRILYDNPRSGNGRG